MRNRKRVNRLANAKRAPALLPSRKIDQTDDIRVVVGCICSHAQVWRNGKWRLRPSPRQRTYGITFEQFTFRDTPKCELAVRGFGRCNQRLAVRRKRQSSAATA